MSMNMSYVFRYIDLISPTAHIYIDKKSRFKNAFGGILTVILSLIIVFLSLFSIVKLFKRENVTLIYNEEFMEQPYFNISNFPIFFNAYDTDGSLFKEPQRLYYFTSRRFIIEDKTVNGTVIPDVKISEIKIEKCETLNNNTDSYYNRLALNSDMVDKFCLDLSAENLYLTGGLGNTVNQSLISISLNKCRNSTANNNCCYPDNVIDSIIGRSTLVIRFSDHYINNNLYNPQISYFKGDAISFAGRMMKIVYYNFINIEYLTDFGFIFSDQQTLKFSKFSESYSESLLMDDGNPGILKVVFGLTKKKAIYIRSFEKLQTVVASLSALIKILVFMFTYFNKFFNEYFYYNFIANFLNLYEYSNNPSKDNIAGSNPFLRKYKIINVNSTSMLNYKNNEMISTNNLNNININLPNANDNENEIKHISQRKTNYYHNNINLNNNNNKFNNEKDYKLNYFKDEKNLDYSTTNQLITNNKLAINKFQVNNDNSQSHEMYQDKLGNYNKNYNLNLNSKENRSANLEKLYELANLEDLNQAKNINKKQTKSTNAYSNINNNNEYNIVDNNLNNNNNNKKVDIYTRNENTNFNNMNQNSTRKGNNINYNNYNNKSNKDNHNNEKIQFSKSNTKNFLSMQMQKDTFKPNNLTDLKIATIKNGLKVKRKFTLNLRCTKILCKKLFCTSSDPIKYLELAIEYIHKKLSIEEIIRKMQEIDKIKFLTIRDNHLITLNNLSGPNIFSSLNSNNGANSESQIKSTNNATTVNENLFAKSGVEQFWASNEFEN